MNIQYFLGKERYSKYKLPKNIPAKNKWKYFKAIEYGYVKYFDIIYHCDGYCMNQQMEMLVGLMPEGKNRKPETNRKLASNIIKNLHELGFVEVDNLNEYKYFYLKKPAIAFVKNDYKSTSSMNRTKDLSHSKLKVSILKIQHLIDNNEIINSIYMLEQLKDITNRVKGLIIKSNNKYGYDLKGINQLLRIKDFKELAEFFKENKDENDSKLGVVRSIWSIGKLCNNMILQRECFSPEPSYLKIFPQKDGSVTVHYIPTIIIFDIDKTKTFFYNKEKKLFDEFFNLPFNELLGVQKTYFDNGKTSMGHEWVNHFGYNILVISGDGQITSKKVEDINEKKDSSEYSPLMGDVQIVSHNVKKYFSHSSRKGEYRKKQELRIDKDIKNALKSMNIK